MKSNILKYLPAFGILALMTTGCSSDQFEDDIDGFILPDNCYVETIGASDMIRSHETSETGLVILAGKVNNISFDFVGTGIYYITGTGEDSGWDFYLKHYNYDDQVYSAFYFQIGRTAESLDADGHDLIKAGMPYSYSLALDPYLAQYEPDYDHYDGIKSQYYLVAPFVPSEPGDYYYRMAMFPGKDGIERYGEIRSFSVELRGNRLYVIDAEIEGYKPVDDTDIVVKK